MDGRTTPRLPKVEGEQVIMSLQCSRFLIKSVNQLRNGQDPVGSALYLKDTPMAEGPFQSWDSSSPEDLVAMFRYRTQVSHVTSLPRHCHVTLQEE